MSDKFPAKIWIGGKVTPDKLAGLVYALHEDGASHAFGDAPITANCTDWDDLATYLDEENLLCLCDDQAIVGEFHSAEEFCIKNGISFDRWSDHYCEYNAENVYYRPGEDIVKLHCDGGGVSIADGRCVEEAKRILNGIILHGVTDNSEAACLAAYNLLLTALPDQPKKLKDFTICG